MKSSTHAIHAVLKKFPFKVKNKEQLRPQLFFVYSYLISVSSCHNTSVFELRKKRPCYRSFNLLLNFRSPLSRLFTLSRVTQSNLTSYVYGEPSSWPLALCPSSNFELDFASLTYWTRLRVVQYDWTRLRVVCRV
jgi:hypothetical protein